MHTSPLSLLALASGAAAQISGFNYGALYADNSARQQADFEADFKAAAALPGVGGFSSARLYTMIQAYTQDTVTSALPAAANTKTSLLLGMWCSSGDAAFASEITALKAAASQFPDADIVGLSVGSEDLYRISVQGIENKSGPGAEPSQIVNYIQQAREALKGTAWENIPVGHVETWKDFTNSSNNAVIENIDFLGMDSYPYYQTTDANNIGNAPNLFFESYAATVGASMGKPVWITETGWPVNGAQSGQATPGTSEAEQYWKGVACKILGVHNTWWYQLNDGAAEATSFRVINPDRGAPLYDLSCPAGSNSTSSSASSAMMSATGTSSVSVSGSVTVNAVDVTGTPTGVVGSPDMGGQNAGVSSGSHSGSAVATNSVHNGANGGVVASPTNGVTDGANGGAVVGSGSGTSSGNSSAPVTGSPSTSSKSSADFTGAAIANAPALALLALGAALAIL